MDAATLQAVTLAIAVTGAVLGIINTWRSLNNDRVRVRLSASHGFGMGGSHCIVLTVVNLSTFPVTITQMGFDRNDGPNHMQIPVPMFTRREALPIRLEPRTSCTAFVPLVAMEKAQLAAIDRAYVNTACGRKVTSGRAVCHQVANAARAGA
jgi:hypothetical protein